MRRESSIILSSARGEVLVDANRPPALAAWLAESGDEARYVDELLAPPADDDAIWRLAQERGFILVSKDADFAIRAARDRSVRLVWIRCGNLKLSAFKQWFSQRQDAMRRLLALNEALIELR